LGQSDVIAFNGIVCGEISIGYHAICCSELVKSVLDNGIEKSGLWSLHVLAYNMKRVVAIIGVGPLLQAIRA
jgi:hypothetical protein